jgi:hypothetical protein
MDKSEKVITGRNEQFIFTTKKETNINITVFFEPENFFVELLVNGKKEIDKTLISCSNFPLGMYAETADLNQDNISDYIIYIYDGGCGFMATACTMTFILSSENGYRLKTINTIINIGNNFATINNRIYFIHADFINTGGHNLFPEPDAEVIYGYWIHNLYTFNNTKIIQANKDNQNFPKIITDDNSCPLYTKESAKLTAKQKKYLLRYQNDIYWTTWTKCP